MKTFRFLTLAVIALLAGGFLQSCSDDDDGPGSSKDLIGLWEQTHVTGWEKENGEIIYETDEEDNTLRAEFRADGTCTTYEYYGGRWLQDYDGDYTYKNGKIYLYDEQEDFEGVMNVISLTSTKLVVEESYKGTDGGDTWENYYKATFRKISDDE